MSPSRILGRSFKGGRYVRGKLDDIAIFRKALADLNAIPQVGKKKLPSKSSALGSAGPYL